LQKNANRTTAQLATFISLTQLQCSAHNILLPRNLMVHTV